MLATFIVNSLLDNGDGANTTLREAVLASNQSPGATAGLPSSVF
jgi:CSLREA domain-containing protein